MLLLKKGSIFYFWCMDVLQRLRENEGAFREVYLENKEYCLNFMRKMYRDDEIIKDIYQNASIVLLEKSRDKDFQLTCSVSTFLTSICRNQLLKHLGSRANNYSTSDMDLKYTEWYEDEEVEDVNKLEIMKRALKELKEKSKNCFEIINRYYYLKQSMKEIAEALSFSNDKSAKNQKAKCMSRLRSFI